MNRCDLLKTILGTTAAAATVHAETPHKYGLVTVESHRGHKKLTGENLHVYVNGVDVSKSCVEADDINGYAEVFCRDQEHHRDLTQKGAVHVGRHGGVCRMRLTGDIRIAPGEEL